MTVDPDRSSHEVDEPLAMSWTIGRVLAVTVTVALILFWAWIFAGGPKRDNPDLLEDREFVEWARTRCTDLNAGIAALPNSLTAQSAAERADVVDQATSLVVDLVDDLEARAPTEGDDGFTMRAWIADWRVYISDRENYADRLRTDSDAQMQITENEELRDGVDQTIKVFADVNNMPECATPADVG